MLDIVMSSTLDITCVMWVPCLGTPAESLGVKPLETHTQFLTPRPWADIKNGSNTTPVFYPTAQKGFPASGVSTRSEMFLPSLRHHDH